MESLNESDLMYLQNASDGKAKAEAVVAFVLSVLTAKYGLKEGDQVTPDGVIIRVGSYAGQLNEITSNAGEGKDGQGETSKPS